MTGTYNLPERAERAILLRHPTPHIQLDYIMTLEFPRIEAGRYSVNDGRKMVGYIEKQSSAKWILYVCSNVAMKGKPMAVKKTLKELKEVAIGMIPSNGVVVNPEPQLDLDSLIRSVRNDEKTEMMREMLERGNVELHQYEVYGDELKEVEPFSEFLTEEQMAAL